MTESSARVSESGFDFVYERILVADQSPDAEEVTTALSRAFGTVGDGSSRLELQVVGIDDTTVRVRVGASDRDVLQAFREGLPPEYQSEPTPDDVETLLVSSLGTDLEEATARIDTWAPRSENGLTDPSDASLSQVARARTFDESQSTEFALLPVLRAATKTEDPSLFQLVLRPAESPVRSEGQQDGSDTDGGSFVARLLGNAGGDESDGESQVVTTSETNELKATIRTVQFSSSASGTIDNAAAVEFARHPFTATLSPTIVPEDKRQDELRRTYEGWLSPTSTFRTDTESVGAVIAELPPAGEWIKENIFGTAHPVETVDQPVIPHLYDKGIQIGRPANETMVAGQSVTIPRSFCPQVLARYTSGSVPPAALGTDFGQCSANLDGQTILIRSRDWTDTEQFDLVDAALRSYYRVCDDPAVTVRADEIRDRQADDDLDALVEEITSDEPSSYILDLADLDSETVSGCVSNFVHELVDTLEETMTAIEGRPEARVSLLLDTLTPLSVTARERLFLTHRRAYEGPEAIGLTVIARVGLGPTDTPTGKQRRILNQVRYSAHSVVSDPAIGGAILSQHARPPRIAADAYERQVTQCAPDGEFVVLDSPHFDVSPQAFAVQDSRPSSALDEPWPIAKEEITTSLSTAEPRPNQPEQPATPSNSDDRKPARTEVWTPPVEALPSHLELDGETLVCLDCGQQYSIPEAHEGAEPLRLALECCGHDIEEADLEELKRSRTPEIDQSLIRGTDYSREFLQFLKLVYLARAGKLDERLEYSITDSMTALRDAVGVEKDEIDQALEEDDPLIHRHSRPHRLYTTTSRARDLLDVSWRRGEEWGEGINDLNASSVHIEGVRQTANFLKRVPWVDEVRTYVEISEEKPWVDREIAQQVGTDEPSRVDVMALADDEPVVLAEFERDSDHPAGLRADQHQMRVVAESFDAEIVYVVPSRTTGQQILSQLRQSERELDDLPDYSTSTQLKSANQRLAEIDPAGLSVVETRKHLIQLDPEEVAVSAESIRELVISWYQSS